MSEIGGVGSGVPPQTAPGPRGEGTAGPALRAGDTVPVEVRQVTGQGEGLLRISGQLLRAVFPGELPQGARLLLRVVTTGPPLVLQLPDTPTHPAARLLTPPAQSLPAALAEFLAAVPPEGPAGDLLRTAQTLLRLPP